MDPLSILVGALAVGAKAGLKDTASTAVKDAYNGLKTLIVTRFGKKASLDSLEEKPGSETKRAAVQEDLAEAGAATDVEVMARAKAVVDAVERDDPSAAAAIGVDLAGVRAAFLTVGDITSEGTGARLRDSSFSGGITIGDVTTRSVRRDPTP